MQQVYGTFGPPIQPFAAGYLLLSRTIITSTGTSTYTTPENARLLFVECIGGGGGGATTANAGAGACAYGSGGCAGGYAASVVNAYPGQTFTVVVNAGGVANGNGNITTFSTKGVSACTLVSATGGNVGTAIASGTTESFTGPGSSPVGSSTGDMATTIGIAALAHRVSGTVAYASGGQQGTRGGASNGRITQGTGAAGGKYGAGGAGGLSFNAGGAGTGGHGGQGVIVVWEFA